MDEPRKVELPQSMVNSLKAGPTGPGWVPSAVRLGLPKRSGPDLRQPGWIAAAA